MRPVPAAQVVRAVQVTSRFPAVHGAPVHIGDPGGDRHSRHRAPGPRRPGGDSRRRGARVLGLRRDAAGGRDGLEAAADDHARARAHVRHRPPGRASTRSCSRHVHREHRPLARPPGHLGAPAVPAGRLLRAGGAADPRSPRDGPHCHRLLRPCGLRARDRRPARRGGARAGDGGARLARDVPDRRLHGAAAARPAGQAGRGARVPDRRPPGELDPRGRPAALAAAGPDDRDRALRPDGRRRVPEHARRGRVGLPREDRLRVHAARPQRGHRRRRQRDRHGRASPRRSRW